MIQLQFLNRILQTKDSSLITLNNLDADYFSDYKREFYFINNHLKEYGNIPDLPSFLVNFPDFEVITVNETESYLLEELNKDKNQRYLANSFNQIRELLMNGKVDGALQVFRDSAENLNKHSNTFHSIDILKDTSRYDAYVERTTDFTKYYVKTGFKELDNVIGGWDREEDLVVVAARTNMGKSFILLKMALAAVEQGLKVGLYSGEMTEKKVGYRLDTLISHIPNNNIIHGNESIQNEYKKHMEKLPTKFKGSLKVITPQTINGPATVSALDTFIQKENLDILFVDQLSLLEDQRKNKNPIEKAASISRDLKNLQVMRRIPIISASQLNRTKNDDNGGGDDLINTTQISMSDRIGQDATIIIGLSRDKKDKNLLKLQVVKARDTGNGSVVKYNTDFNKGSFIYIPEDEDNNSINNNADDSIDYENRYNQDLGGDEF